MTCPNRGSGVTVTRESWALQSEVRILLSLPHYKMFGGVMPRKKILLKALRKIPLEERLKKCQGMIGKMCSEGRPPKMTIPVHWDDEDFFISNTIGDALEKIASSQQPDPKPSCLFQGGDCHLDNACGVGCESYTSA